MDPPTRGNALPTRPLPRPSLREPLRGRYPSPFSTHDLRCPGCVDRSHRASCSQEAPPICAESSDTSAPSSVDTILLEGLERLEYRGYDSAGISLFDAESGEFETIRAVGNLAKLREAVGDGRARCALRHRPHPLGDPRAPGRAQRAPVPLDRRQDHGRAQRHHRELRRAARASSTRAGYDFTSETDAEVVPFLVERPTTAT